AGHPTVHVGSHGPSAALTAIGETLLGHADDIVDEIMARGASSVPGYARLPPEAVRPGAITAVSEMVTRVLLGQRPPDADDRARFRDMFAGRIRAVGVDAILEGQEISLGVFWDATVAAANQLGIARADLFEFAVLMQSWERALIAELVIVGRRVERETAARDRRRRDQLIHDLLVGEAATDDV